MTRSQADRILLLIAFAWGLSYILTDIALVEITPLWQIFWRFIIAFILIYIIARPRLRFPSINTMKYSFFLGIALVAIYIGATYGVKYTTLTNASFLSCLQVGFIPFFSLIFFKQKVPRKFWIVSMIMVLGVALISLDDNFAIKPENLKGDLFCLLTSASYAIHLLLTEQVVKKPNVNPFQLGAYQMFFCALITLVLALIFEEWTTPVKFSSYSSLFILAIFCTGLAFIMQPIAQQYTTARHVSIIYTMEPVFAGLIAWIFAGEKLPPRGIVGAVILVASLLYMELTNAEKKES